MNLAERIKTVLREKNALDYKSLSDVVIKIFTEHPTHYISINPSFRFQVSEKDYLGMWSIDIPKEWIIEISSWAEGNGFRIDKRMGQNGNLLHFFIHLI